MISNHIFKIKYLIYSQLLVFLISFTSSQTIANNSIPNKNGFYFLSNLPDKSLVSFYDIYVNSKNIKFIGAAQETKTKNLYKINLFTFPYAKETDIQITNNADQLTEGYYQDQSPLEHELYDGDSYYRFSQVEQEGYKVQNCQSTLLISSLKQKYINNNQTVNEIMYFVELPNYVETIIGNTCYYYNPANVKQKLVSVSGYLYQDKNIIYIIDVNAGLILPINKDLSIDAYCKKDNVYYLNFKKYIDDYESIINFSGPKNYESQELAIKNLLKDIKLKECLHEPVTSIK